MNFLIHEPNKNILLSVRYNMAGAPLRSLVKAHLKSVMSNNRQLDNYEDDETSQTFFLLNKFVIQSRKQNE